MTPYDEYDPETGESRASVWQRMTREQERAAARNFVPATPAPLARRDQTIDAVPQWLTPLPPLDVAQAWTPQQAAKETTSAVDRAKGVRIRLVPYVVLFGLGGLVVGWLTWYIAGNAPVAAALAVTVTVVAGLLMYRRMNLDDYDHSGAGVERLRITEAADLQREQMAHEQELKKMAFEAWLKKMEREQ